MPDANVAVLNRVLARESSALLPYLRNAIPWTSASESEAEKSVRVMMDEHEADCQQLAGWITAQRQAAASARFPHEFASAHFIALDGFFPWLVAFQKWLIETLEADLTGLTAPEPRRLAETMLATNRRHLGELTKLAAEHSGAKSTSTKR